MGSGGAGVSAEQKAFDTLKQALMNAPVLAHPDPHQQWIVQTDASGFAIGAVLSQKQKDEHGAASSVLEPQAAQRSTQL